MKVVRGYPPNITEISKRFGAKVIQKAVFTYGDTCYSPGGVDLPLHLHAHEETHMRQQGLKPEIWWSRYLTEPQFRLEQELEAYQKQYQYIQANLNRAERRRLTKKIIKDFASPLYGNLLTEEEAARLIAA